MRKLATFIGLLETIALLVCAIALPFAHTSGTQNASASSSKALAVTCLLFGLFAIGCTWGLSREGNWANTPYFLVQVFVLIAGTTLFQASATIVRVLSVAVLLTGIAGLVGWFSHIRQPLAPENLEL